MSRFCRNCNYPLTGKYCSNCSQPSDTDRLTIRYIWEDLKSGLLHYNAKVFHTGKQLLLRPGDMIRGYIEGKRIEQFQPISFLLVLAGMYVGLTHYFHLHIISDTNSNGDEWNIDKAGEWISTHYAWTVLLTVPFYALASYLAFKKHRYNYIEHFIINAYIACQQIIIRIITLPALYLMNNSPHLNAARWGISAIVSIFMIWSFIQLFNRIPKIKALGLSLLILFLFNLVLITCTAIVVLIIS